MADDTPHKFYISTALKGKMEIHCPICGHNEFLDLGPKNEALRRTGFKHVVVGVIGENHIAYSPVRFQHCANCGFIVQFVIGSTDGEKQ